MAIAKQIRSGLPLVFPLLFLTFSCTTVSSDTSGAAQSLCSQLPRGVDPAAQQQIWVDRISQSLQACRALLAKDVEEPDLHFYAGRLEMLRTRPAKAEHHFRVGAEAGSVKAITALGYFLAERKGTPRAMTKLYKRAADMGDPVAQTQLGIMYWGVDAAWSSAVPRNTHRAKDLLHAAAEQGDPVAHYALGILLWPSETGGAHKGTIQQALHHIRAAAKAGLSDARDTLVEKGYQPPKPPSQPNPMATLFDRDRILMRP